MLRFKEIDRGGPAENEALQQGMMQGPGVNRVAKTLNGWQRREPHI